MRSARILLTSATVGTAVLAIAVFVLGLPSRVRQGERGQAAIQMLDGMRRPFLEIKQAETALIRTGDVGTAGRRLAEASNSASDLLDRYRQLAQYNPDLTLRVAELRESYASWLAAEKRLFETYASQAGSSEKPRPTGALPENVLAEAAAGFLAAMNRLGDGEEPIHRDIDDGRWASHALLGLSALLFLYTFILIALFQRSGSRRLLRAYGDMERRVAEREGIFRAIVEAAPECLKVLALDGTVLEMNPAGLAMVEADAPDLVIGHSIYPLICPEHRLGFRDHLLKVCEGKGGIFEFEIVGLKGTRRWMRTRTVRLKDYSRPRAACLALTQDITFERQAEAALREKEESFRALADNATDSIVVAVEPERHVYANRPAAEMLGYAVEELLAKTPRDIVHPDEYPKLAERLRKRLAGEDVPNRYEAVILHKDGRLVPVEVTAARTTWRGRPASIVITRDMTERKQAEEERAALYQQNRALLRQLLNLQEEERKRLAQEIHDDLGQALTAIMTNARLIAKNSKASRPEYGEAARDIVSIADGVYENVQRMSRRLRPSALDDLGLMDALRTMVETSPLKKDGVDLTISFGGELRGLEDRVNIALYRVLQECLTNISKHSGADHVGISLQRTPGGAGADDGKSETVDLVIEDNGRGIDQARASRGLGLIGIRERVETLGGEFHLVSGSGKGTSVRVSVPVSPTMERTGV